MTEMLWDPEPTTTEEAWSLFRAHGADPRFYRHDSEEWQILEHWWLDEMRRLPTAELEDELAYVTANLVELRLNPDTAQGAIDGVQYEPIQEQRSKWLAGEINRRRALPPTSVHREGSRISREFVQDLKRRIELPVFLTGEMGFADLKRHGSIYTGSCPFHVERTPSFTVWSDHWHCFGACQQSGDVFDMLIVSSTCRTWRQAVEYAARYAGVSMPQPPEPIREPQQPVSRGPAIQGIVVPTL